MGLFEHFPYTNFHDLNLDWLLNAMRELEQNVKDFVSINAIKYADPIQWNITTQYEKNTVTIDPNSGIAYLSVQPVPAGVNISNTDYWTVIFDLSMFIDKSAKNLTNHVEQQTNNATFNSNVGDWLIWYDNLYVVTAPITIGTTYVVEGNIHRITIEEVITTIVNNIGDLTNLQTPSNVDIVTAINETYLIAEKTNLYVYPEDYGAIGDGATDDSAAIQSCIDANPNKTICFRSTYAISTPIHTSCDNSKMVSLYFNNFAGLIAKSDFPANEFMIQFGIDDSINSMIFTHAFIIGGIINCNEIANGIQITQIRSSVLNDINIINVNSVGLQTGSISDTVSSDTCINDVRIFVSRGNDHALGVLLYTNDNKLANIRTYRTFIGIKILSLGNYFEYIHPVADGADYITNYENTIGLDIQGNYNFICNCYCDNFSKQINIGAGYSATLTNVFAFWYSNTNHKHYVIYQEGSDFATVISGINPTFPVLGENIILKFGDTYSRYTWSELFKKGLITGLTMQNDRYGNLTYKYTDPAFSTFYTNKRNLVINSSTEDIVNNVWYPLAAMTVCAYGKHDITISNDNLKFRVIFEVSNSSYIIEKVIILNNPNHIYVKIGFGNLDSQWGSGVNSNTIMLYILFTNAPTMRNTFNIELNSVVNSTFFMMPQDIFSSMYSGEWKLANIPDQIGSESDIADYVADENEYILKNAPATSSDYLNNVKMTLGGYNETSQYLISVKSEQNFAFATYIVAVRASSLTHATLLNNQDITVVFSGMGYTITDASGSTSWTVTATKIS